MKKVIHLFRALILFGSKVYIFYDDMFSSDNYKITTNILKKKLFKAKRVFYRNLHPRNSTLLKSINWVYKIYAREKNT